MSGWGKVHLIIKKRRVYQTGDSAAFLTGFKRCVYCVILMLSMVTWEILVAILISALPSMVN